MSRDGKWPAHETAGKEGPRLLHDAIAGGKKRKNVTQIVIGPKGYLGVEADALVFTESHSGKRLCGYIGI